jgi:hypothetical protein
MMRQEGRQIMVATIGYDLGLAIDRMWISYLQLGGGFPYWDPYGAVTGIFMAITIAGLVVRKILE